MNQVSKKIIIIKQKDKIKKGGDGREGDSVEERDIFIFIFLFFVFFFHLRKSDHRFSSGLKAKLVHAWIPKSWSFVKLHEVGNFPTCVISSLKVI